MSEPTLKLIAGADELLRDFPIKEPDFEAQAKAIEARLKGDGQVSDPGALLPPSAGLSLDDLFKAPGLVAEAGEPMPPSSVRVAEPPKSNFAEMARKSVQKGTADSTELAKDLLAATAQSRRPNAAMVERVRAAGRPIPSASSTPLPASEASPEEAQRTSGVVARAELAKPAPNNRGTFIGIAGGVLALAACVALFVKSGQSESPTSAALAAEKASQLTAAAPHAAPGAAAAAAAAKPSEGLSPEAFPETPPGAHLRLEAKATAKGGPAAAPPGKVGAAPPGAKPEAVELADDPTPAPVAVAPEKKAEPAAPEPPLKPAQGASGDVPLTPSAGAVSSALSSVRGSAQACLAGQSEAVSAVVTFAADGHVLKVSAGGPAAACIQGALSKAHIRPFAKESFSANMMIRPP